MLSNVFFSLFPTSVFDSSIHHYTPPTNHSLSKTMSDGTNHSESDSDSRSFVRDEFIDNISDMDNNVNDVSVVIGSTIRSEIEIEAHEGKYANIMIPTDT